MWSCLFCYLRPSVHYLRQSVLSPLSGCLLYTSCKDYDDDIDQINQKLDGVEATVADLQKKIGDGAFVKSITPTAVSYTHLDVYKRQDYR